MTELLQFDDSMSRRLEATYTTPDVIEQRRAVRATLGLRAGEHVLDIGSGPGFLACEMAEILGSGGSVHGIDPSASMLSLAQQRRAAAGAAPVTFGTGEATALSFPDASFDAVTSTQVYEYVPDVAAALAEAYRVLRPGGRLLVLDTDWDSIVWHATDAARMQRILSAWEEHLVDSHLPRRLTGLLGRAGFTVQHRGVIPLLNAGFDPNTYSAGMMELMAAFVVGRRGVSEAEARAWADDLKAMGADYFFSLNRYSFLATK